MKTSRPSFYPSAPLNYTTNKWVGPGVPTIHKRVTKYSATFFANVCKYFVDFMQ